MDSRWSFIENYGINLERNIFLSEKGAKQNKGRISNQERVVRKGIIDGSISDQ